MKGGEQLDELNLKAAGGQLLLSDLDNPNKMTFEGVLTYLGVPSDVPPGGSGGLKVLIPVEVGREALPSLIGTPVNLAASMDDHDTSSVVGVINEAWLGDETPKGVPIHVRGHIFAKSFPNEARAIKASQASLGFSYETAKTSLQAGKYNGEDVAVATSLVFTGAAILFKHAAAYQSTSLAASADVLAYIQSLEARIAELEAAKVSTEERKHMDDSDFAVPGKRKLLINDAKHVRLAWDMVDRTEGLTPEERAEARRRILRKAHELGIDTSDWNKPGDVQAAGEEVQMDEKETTQVDEQPVEAAADASTTEATEVTASESTQTTETETAGAEVSAASTEADDTSLDEQDVALDKQLVALLPQVLQKLDALLAKFEATEVTAAAEQEPPRRSESALVTKYADAPKAAADLLASATVEDDPVKSMANKLGSIFG